MARTVLYDGLDDCFEAVNIPGWYDEAVEYLRGDKDRGRFGLYLYNLIQKQQNITEIVNIGTARGHSAVCAAKALTADDRKGNIHTIDVIDPAEPRVWYNGSPPSDPLKKTRKTMRELVTRFHNPSNSAVPIHFHTGDSNDILTDLNCDPDLVFHDGRHTYRAVRADIELTNQLAEQKPIHVFDDCYLYRNKWNYRPFTGELWYGLDKVPKIGGFVRTLRSLSISRSPFPGLTMAARWATEESSGDNVEIVRDPEHAPITALFPA